MPLVAMPLLIALLAPALVLLVARLHRAWTGATATLLAALTFGAMVVAWLGDASPIDHPWIPSWDARLALALDALAAPWALLASGIGMLVAGYASVYLPRFHEHHHVPPEASGRFFASLSLFMAAMLGVVMAQDLVLLFVFWDLTAVASWSLIGHDRASEESRSAALMALLVTGITSMGVMVAALLLHAQTGSFALRVLTAQAEPGRTTTAAALLLAVAALAKSAQVPLHFWLPRAMAAPTPVSAYLHSAAMVAAGVFLLARIHPLLARSPGVLDALVALGLLSIVVGSALALTRDRLKQLLAYSTVAQYGYVTTMLGLGGPEGAAGAVVYVVAHAVAKSALFLAAGAVTEATGEDRLSRIGGLGRRLPGLAVASGIAAAALAGLPLTVGYFKDETFFAAALARGPAHGAVAAACAALTLAYTWRFWSGTFLGKAHANAHAVPVALVAPVAALAAIALGLGLWPRPLASLASGAGTAILGRPASIGLAYHLTAPETFMALVAWAGGAALVALERWWRPPVLALARVGARLGPERAYQAALHALNDFSRRILRWELRDLRNRIAPVLVPSAAMVGLALVVTWPGVAFDTGPVERQDVPLALALLLASGAALGATVPRRHLALALMLSAAGFSLAAAYAFFGAPDVALVAVLVETTLSLLLIGVLSLFPPAALREQAARPGSTSRRHRDAGLALAAAAFAFVVAWSTLSRPAADATMADAMRARVRDAHGHDAVTVILADFRGLDTLGETTVVGVALMGVVVLLMRRR
ncbi:MAG TPA: hydrogen gas-evolving membrane-bound hydrogenase subunit E [Candidatus Tectomicrobia bacterium]|nr:hydrogen gas-evolving membrane-bound hydrogenase subunit E [Candidatus Tectomicrobia bacterium]